MELAKFSQFFQGWPTIIVLINERYQSFMDVLVLKGKFG